MYTFNFETEVDTGTGAYCSLVDVEVEMEGMVDGYYEVHSVRLYDLDNNVELSFKDLPKYEQTSLLDRVHREAEKRSLQVLEAEMDARYEAALETFLGK